MKKLLFVYLDLPAFNHHWRYRISRVRESGYDVHVAVPGNPGADDGGMKWLQFPLARKGKNPFKELFSIIALYKLILREKPDIIHAATIKPNIYSCIAAKLSGIDAPVIMSTTGLGSVFVSDDLVSRVLRFIALALYKWLAGNRHVYITFENKDDRALYLEHGIGDEQRCIRVSGPGVDVAQYQPFPEPTSIPLVILPARMLWTKGAGDFVEAARLLRQKGIKARFALVGGLDAENAACIPKAQLDAWHASGVVEWWGHRSDMTDIFAQSHIVCLPSYREGMPKVLIEAAACSRPIVTADVAGCREIVRHRENGLLIPKCDPEKLAAALEELIADPAMRLAMGKKGRDIVVGQYTQEITVTELLSLYAKALSINQ